MKAVILAGGLGTRLRPLTLTTPKPLIPLANKPAIAHIVEYLASHGFKEIVVTTNYQRERLISFLSKEYGKSIRFQFPEEPSPLGTAGSVKNASLNETAFIIQGDNITDIDIKKLISFHKSRKGLATIALMPVENPSLFGIAEIDDSGKIERFVEKPSPENCFSNLASIGLYVIEPEAMELVPENQPFDFAKDLFPILVREEAIYGCTVEGFWTDIGTFEGYMKAHEWILRSNNDSNTENANIKDSEIDGFVAIGSDSVIEESKIRGYVAIGENVHVRKCKIQDSVVFQDAKMTRAFVRGSILAEKCIVNGGRIEKSVVGASSYLRNANIFDEKISPFSVR